MSPPKLITLDFETYYSQEYSLSKLTTEQYIRDPRFQIIGVGTKVGAAPARWESFETLGEYREYLAPLAGHNVIAHNMLFDGAILSWRLGVQPKMMFDTLSMARPLHGLSVGGSLKALAEHYAIGEKGTEVVKALGKRREDFSQADLAQYGEYCKNDCDLTWALFKIFMRAGFPKSELVVIDMLLRMFTEPVITLDTECLQEHLSLVKERKAELMSKLEIGRDELMSNPKLAAVLQGLGVEPPTKFSPANPELRTYAFAKTDEAFKVLLEHDDERVQAVVAARLGVKTTIEETRTERFLGIASRGALPVPLMYYGGHTGRASGTDGINLQNLTRGGKLRKSLRAPDGHVFVVGDSSQIEARTVAWWAGEDALVEAFAEGKDIYSLFASDIYGYEVVKDTHVAERQVGKVAILGLGYGMSAVKFKLTVKAMAGIDIDDATAERVVALYRAKYSKIKALWGDAQRALQNLVRGHDYDLGVAIQLGCKSTPEEATIALPNGLWLRYPKLRQIEREFMYDTKRGRAVIPKRLYGAKVVENATQALARIIVFDQMVALGRQYRPVLTVHDEIVVVVPEEERDTAVAVMKDVMSRGPKWVDKLPIACAVGYANSYGDAK